MKLTSEVLKQQRIALGKTQAQIAEMAGLNKSTICLYEKGNNAHKLQKLLEAYSLEVYPSFGDALPSMSIDGVREMVKKMVKDSLGSDCKVKINIEFGDGK